MSNDLSRELVRITRAQNEFRRDRNLIPKCEKQLQRINKQLQKLSEFPMTKNQAE